MLTVDEPAIGLTAAPNTFIEAPEGALRNLTMTGHVRDQLAKFLYTTGRLDVATGEQPQYGGHSGICGHRYQDIVQKYGHFRSRDGSGFVDVDAGTARSHARNVMYGITFVKHLHRQPNCTSSAPGTDSAKGPSRRRGASPEIHHVAALHMVDMPDGALPCLGADADIAAEGILQLEQQHEDRGDHGHDRRGHHQMGAEIPHAEKSAEANDADRADEQDEPVEPRDAAAIGVGVDVPLPRSVNDRQMLQGCALRVGFCR